MPSIAFEALDPQWGQMNDGNRTPENRMGGNLVPGEYWLTFRCPACTKGLIAIHVAAEARSGYWKADPLPSGQHWPSLATLTPSIDNTRSGHGRKAPSCAFHGNIINGQVTWP
jgi:hypothetical protein